MLDQDLPDTRLGQEEKSPDRLARILVWGLGAMLVVVIGCVVVSFGNWRFRSAPAAPPSPEQITAELPTPPAEPTAVVTEELGATVRPSAVPKVLVATPALFSTSRPAVPPPDDWPTGVPWPPPTQVVQPVSTPHPFPTPDVTTHLDSRPAVLQTLWFPHYPAPGSVGQMRAVSVSEQGQQWAQLDSSLDLALPAPDVDGASLVSLHPSPDGHWLIADFAYAGSRLVDLSSGEAIDALVGDPGVGEYRFRAWHPDGQHVLVMTSEGLASVDLAAQTTTAVGYYDGPEFDHAQLGALAYSPSVDLLADAVIYPATYGVREVDVVEIGLVGPDGVREPIAQIPGGTSVLAHSLKWSPDGQRLMWIASVGSQDAGPVRLAEIETQLWMMDFARRDDARMLAVLGRGVEVKHPAVWSPDGLSIAALFVEPREAGANDTNVFLLDAGSGAKQQITHFADEQLSHLTWSPKGQSLAFTVARGAYGEIWATSLDGGQQYPIAGPTFSDAPFVWLSESGEE
jgi:WD40 repeat protein